MAHVNRTETRADHFTALSIELRADGTPIMVSGRTIKSVEYTTTVCPECYDDRRDRFVAAWRDDHGDEVCPECGIVCEGSRKAVWPGELAYGTTPENDSIGQDREAAGTPWDF